MRKTTRARHPGGETVGPAIPRSQHFGQSSETASVAHAAAEAATPQDADATHEAADETSAEYVDEANASQVVGHEFGKLPVVPRRGLVLSQPSDPDEREADRIARALPVGDSRAHSAAQVTLPANAGSKSDPSDSRPQVPDHVAAALAAALRNSDGRALEPTTQSYMGAYLGRDLAHVRVHTDSTAAALSHDLSAAAFTYGRDVFFGAGRSPSISRLTAHELTHVTHDSAPAVIARQDAATEDRTEAGLDEAAAEASKEMKNAVEQRFLGVSNVRDVNSAHSLLGEVQTATPTLDKAMGKRGWGPGVTNAHKLDNTATEKALSVFLEHAGEETRAASDFKSRYALVKQHFAKLEGMAREYMAMNGDIEIKSAEDIVKMETGKDSAGAGAQAKALTNKKDATATSVAATASRKRIGDLRRSNGNLATQLKQKDSDVSSQAIKVIGATNRIESAVNAKKGAPEEADTKEVAAVKTKMKAVKSMLGEGVKAAKSIPQLKAVIEGAEKVNEVAEQAKSVASAAGKDVPIPTAGEFVDVVLADIYKEDMENALAIQNVARSMSEAERQLADSSELEAATRDYAQSVRTRKELADQLDAGLRELKTEVRELGKTLDEAYTAKNPNAGGSGYKVVAQFLSEADPCITETDVALQAGDLELQNAKLAESKLNVVNARGSEKRMAFHRAQEIGERWEVQTRHVFILSSGEGSSGGEGGSTKIIESMVKELKTGKELIQKYQQVLSKALGI
jgi:hypothetical protein